MTTTTDRSTEIRDKVATTRTVVESRYLIALPPLPSSAPAALARAFHEYATAREEYHQADTDVLGAEAQVDSAQTRESEEIAALVRAGDDPLTVSDKVAEAERELLRCATVLLVRAQDLGAAVANVHTAARRHQEEMRAAVQPAINQRGAAVTSALRDLRQVRSDFARTVEVAAWWDSIGQSGRGLPSFGTASRGQARTAMGDYAVADDAASAALTAPGL